MKLKQLLQFGIPNSALRIIIFTFLINGCFLTAKYNHPMDGIGGIILNAVLLNTTRNASLPQTVVLTGLPSVITEGQSASVDVKLALATTSAIQVTLTLDNPAITVDGLASKVLTFSPENATVNQTIKVAAVTDSNNVSELVNMKVTATGLADQTVSISAVDTNVAKPTITVSIGSTEYKNGDTFTFNVTKSNVDNSQNISIINNTNASLTLTGAIKVTIGGANSSNFSVIQPSVTTIIPSGSTNFTLVFNTSYTTDRIASITIQNDDLTNPNYTLNIIGKCNPESDSFVFTGDLINARYSHTASLLSNGKVLVTGGTNVGTLSSAELYDPATGSFTATGNMTVSRTDHTATRLNNGNILIVGGGSNTTELYDPNTGTFTATGNAGGSYSTATLLNNGNVLVAGNVTNTAKLYDPSTGLFTATTGNMVAARNFVPTILLGNGKVLFAGGYVPACPVSTAELYDPGTGTFSATGSIGTVRLSTIQLSACTCYRGFNKFLHFSRCQCFGFLTVKIALCGTFLFYFIHTVNNSILSG
jgi:hypothetical protein